MSTDNPREFDDTTLSSSHEKLRLVVSWLLVFLLIGFGLFLMFKLANVHKTEGDYWQTLIREQFPVLVGLPMAGLGSLFLTLVLRLSTGPMEFEVSGVKFKGAAAPIVFWLLCFLSVALTIGLLWQ